MQKMINICSDYCKKFCLSFNAKKSKVLLFGKRMDMSTLAPLLLNNVPLEFVNELKYLGTTIVAGKSFGFTARPDIASFYRAANSVLNVLTNAQENTLMQLLYTNCVPILSYACPVKFFSAAEMSNCNTAINNVVRKIFGFQRWESVRTLRELFGYQSIYQIFANAKIKFHQSCLKHHNDIISFIASLEVD